MAEIVDDIKVKNVEISGDLGLNFSSYNSRIKHSGLGEFEILSYGRIELKTDTHTDSCYVESEVGCENEEEYQSQNNDNLKGNIDVIAENRMRVTVEGKDYPDDTGALIIETKRGGINIEAKHCHHGTIDMIANSDYIDAIDIEATNGGIKMHADGITTGDIDIYAKLNIDMTADSNAVDAIDIEATNGGIKMYADGITTGNIDIDAILNIDMTAQANSVNAIEIESLNGGISIRAGQTTNTNGVVEILSYSTSNNAINITSTNGGIEIKTEDATKDIRLITHPNDSVIIPYKLEAGFVHQEYQPTTNPPSYALLVPTGAVIPYAGGSAPGGWLLCNGASLSTTTYSTLFAVIGTTYGGSGGSFNIPDLRSRLPLGARAVAGDGLSQRNLGNTGGQEGITNVPEHTHTLNNNNAVTVVTIPDNDSDRIDTGASGGIPGGHAVNTITVDNTGIEGGVNVMNPFLVLNYIIKV